MTPEQKQQIDNMTFEQMLYLNRFAPMGHPMFQLEVGDYFMKVMGEKREADPESAIQSSKDIGWTK